ncbi:1-aminocyclopropane-1-carboxylate deaminase/D-cysteine desulfhydrase [Vibrio sp. JPW-9-11-11]|uniref:1-aminocyclopropane-1-carboxylate deaminase/D-cysteine desulfhydrase n=1 Tax=Vibrio sp. JPW-9-11-11 TaxID=1416532 RepID=UPI00159411E9|nr:1-aminocyclopropane-1-carboxylate deaminase/D-cysteine desulfhydrase [Vibrio sp. JPW-9-11-11]NVD06344.1 1-aminocyclopropane-1-carboxylate deaminase/D-cysteine desulfhydrase [Vibrio sp. JPW-9-11-11]
MKLANTPITQHQFADIPFYLKRDDQIHCHFSGNKARKFMALLEQEFPDIRTLIGYGSAQANSLFSLASLASIKGWQFEFYVDHLPQWLIDKPIGNYRGALELGAKVISTSDHQIHPSDYIKHVRQPDSRCLVVPEGGRSSMARVGIEQLAREILSWTRFEPHKEFVVALPAGTGTTSLYLHKYLKPHSIRVITCPCVGGKEYLIKQFQQLGEDDFPEILELDYKHHFGKLYHQDYRIWQQLLAETHVEFDLLYDPMMWQCLQSWYRENQDKTIIYVHQGGILGNESMLPRYERKYGPRFGEKK